VSGLFDDHNMRRAILSSVSCKFFVQLSGSSGWMEVLDGVVKYGSPSFGILDGRILPDVQRSFPTGIFLDGTSIKHGVWDRNSYDPVPPQIRDSRAFLRRERQAFYSLQRQATAGHMTYSEMQVFISSLTDFLWGQLTESKARCGIMTEAPHTLGGLILAGLAEAKGLPILHFQKTGMASAVRPHLGPDYTTVPWLTQESKLERESRKAHLEAEFEVIDRFFEDARSGKLYFVDVENQRKESATFRTLKGPWRRVFIPLSWRLEERKALESASASEQQIPGSLSGLTSANSSRVGQFLKSVVEALRQARQLRTMRSKLRAISSDSLPSSYALMFLHNEPERTSVPDGGVYGDQLFAVRSVAKKLEGRMTLVVKEHPTQLTLIKRGFRARSMAFYRELESIPNVVVVSDECDRRSLLSSSRFVVTLTGKVALEAAAIGRPVVALGHAWYSDLPGVFCCHGSYEVDKAIEDALEFSSDDSRDFVDSLKKRLCDEFILFRINPSESRRFDSAQDHESMVRVCAAFLLDSSRVGD